MVTVKQPYAVRYYKGLKAKEVDWLWYPYIPYGKITIIQGDPGEGKSTIAINLAAILSTGKPMPLENIENTPKTVVYQNSEDGKEDTIVPRLMACGADLTKVAYIEETDSAVELGDERLAKVIDDTGARVLILDPIQSYWGESTDMNRAGAIRPIMNQLANIAQQKKCAIILIGHMTKGNGKGLYRGLGSIDIAAAARSVLLVARLKNKPEMRVLAHVKSNLAPMGDSILFSLDGQSSITWLRKSKLTAEQILTDSYEESNSKLDRAMAIISKCIEDGECSANEVLQQCEDQGISKRTVNEAKARLNINSIKRKDGWYWVVNSEDEADDED